MEFIFFALSFVSLFFAGFLASEKQPIALFCVLLSFVFFIAFTMKIMELPIKIKSTEKLELIETITTPTDTIYKYQIINK